MTASNASPTVLLTYRHLETVVELSVSVIWFVFFLISSHPLKNLHLSFRKRMSLRKMGVLKYKQYVNNKQVFRSSDLVQFQKAFVLK